MVLFDLIVLGVGILFAWLALTQIILPTYRGTKLFPALYAHHRVLAFEERRVLTETDHALQRIEISKLRERLKALEDTQARDAGVPYVDRSTTTEAPKGPEVPRA